MVVYNVVYVNINMVNVKLIRKGIIWEKYVSFWYFNCKK